LGGYNLAFQHSFSSIAPTPTTSFLRPFRTVRRLTAASAAHSFSDVPVAGDAPAPPAQGLHPKAAIGAVERIEETMQVLTLIERMRLAEAVEGSSLAFVIEL
jgi:hypothetical protein